MITRKYKVKTTIADQTIIFGDHGWRFVVERYQSGIIKAKVTQLGLWEKAIQWKMCTLKTRPTVNNDSVRRIYLKSGEFSERLNNDMTIDEFTRRLIVAYDYVTIDDGM